MFKWQRDKWKHFIVGIPLGMVLQFASSSVFSQLPVSTGLAFAVLVVVCYGFELFSKFTGKGHYDMVDAVAGIIGGVIGIIVFLPLSIFI